MAVKPQEVALDISPQSRFEITDITKRVSEVMNGDRAAFRRATYCSYHTTAGYLDQSLCSRLNYQVDKIKSYINTFQQLFPINADYRHDRMELRDELSEEQRRVEPKNADSHLTFIGSGLRNVVTYQNVPETPVYFIELDGMSEHGKRKRLTKAMYYNEEEVVFEHSVQIPVSEHPVDSVNLRDPRLGYLERLNDILHEFDIERGRIDISLDPSEQFAGLTVNEYETLLMTHDLVQVIKNPLKYMGEKGKYILQHPEKLRSRTKEYAKYDFVHIFNELMDTLHISDSVVESALANLMAYPAEKFLRVKRGVSFLISNKDGGHVSEIVQGRYQSPILVQWKKSEKQSRAVKLTVTRYK
jgi:thiamine phosphate synthase YjbQ (UPF0047 family)